MKKNLLLLALALFGTAFAQCPEGDIVFTTQSEIDNFAANYPDCEIINGNLIIGSQTAETNITDISALSNIRTVMGYLTISFTQLVSLHGLENLRQVTRDFGVSFNSELTSLEALSNFTSVGALGSGASYFAIYNNPNLTSLEGIGNVNLTWIGGPYGLYLVNNGNLSICNFPNICTYLNYSPATRVRTISGNAGECFNEASLTAVCDQECPFGYISINSQAELNHFAIVYPECTEITGLYIGYNGPNDVSNLTPLGNITTVNDLIVIQRTELTSLQGLNITTIVNNLVFNYNNNLTSIALSTLESCSWLSVVGNPLLANLAGLENLTTLRNLSVGYNDNLTSLEGLNNLVSTSGYVAIGSNPSLTSLDGLNNLTSIGNALQISSNPSLLSLEGLNNVNSVGSFVEISGNQSLTSIQALNGISYINGELYISQNNSLTSLSGIDNIHPSGITKLTIQSSSNLSMCNYPNICSYLSAGGLATITGNATGCASAAEIEEACGEQDVISLVGTATEAGTFESDYILMTTDYVNYSISNMFLAGNGTNSPAYKVKFRKNSSWDNNWGGTDFPSGIGVQNGAEIPIVQAGYYNVTLNIESGAYNFSYMAPAPSIGIVGTAVNGLDNDVILTSVDGKTYYINNYTLTSGELKFRQDGLWAINWGADAFPSGSGFQDGPEIPIVAGTYNITFNRLTGFYQFADILNIAPVINDHITLYPNPAITTLNIEVPDNVSIDEITITDLSGKTVMEQRGNSTLLNVENLAAGMYFIKLKAGDKNYVQKFVKE